MPRGDRPPEPLSQPEVSKLLGACDTDRLTGVRNHALIVTMWRAGLRCQEALDLRPSDVDFTAGTIRIRFGKGRKARTVGVDDSALAVLGVWLDARKNAGIRGSALFCTLKPGHAGYPLRPRYVRTVLAQLGTAAGIEKTVRPHGLRHTHAVELRREGWSVPEIARDLGHSSIATTQTYIDHLFPAEVIDRARAREWAS